MMKKVLIIANYKGHVGGISGQVEMLHQNLQSEPDYQAHIFSTIGNLFSRIGVFCRLLWKARMYDVLHIHGCSERGFLPIVYGILAGKLWRKRIIVTYHGGGADDYFTRHGAFARRWLNRADKVIVLNGYLEKVFAKYEIPCVVIPNIIELSESLPHSDYQWNAPRLISVRHLRELYNIPCILRAFQRVQQLVPKASLTILGDGPLRKQLEDWVIKNKVRNVQFIGQVDRNEIVSYLVQSDIFVSAPHIDNMPVSVMEAMNSKVLVICSRVGGVPYMIRDREHGLLFEDDDDKQMAERIIWALEHREESLGMIENACDEIKKYSWKNIRQQLLLLYEQ